MVVAERFDDGKWAKFEPAPHIFVVREQTTATRAAAATANAGAKPGMPPEFAGRAGGAAAHMQQIGG